MSDAMLPPDPVDQLAEEFAHRLRAGERPSAEEYARRYPQRADEIRAALSAVRLLEQLKPQRQDMPPDRLPLRLGEYRIVREIGRGGMGVVYEAEQEALGRRVALKVLAAHLLANERSRSRFRREAQAAGRLHHTNIVPVFGVGECDGLCFYVMQLIDGQGLDQAIHAASEASRLPHPRKREDAPPATDPDHTVDAPGGPLPYPLPQAGREGRVRGEGLPGAADVATTAPEAELPPSPAASPPFALSGLPPHDYWRSVARVGIQVADALAYAHAHGVLHRDVKPSNLLLDAQGTVWVTDFGVAKLVEEANLTQSGELVGTLRYMPPERFAGHTDARGDLYSLGVTLYEMLTLRPAFPDTNPQHLIQLIHEHTPPRPRAVNPAVPRDLETVILKAMARDPAQRYAGAEELADDLRRFLDDRPVLAKRAGPVERAWRWCRRNPALATTTLAALLLMAAVTVVSVVAYARTAAANREAEQALQSEQEQRRHAEHASTLALEALNRTYDRFAPTRLVVTPQATNVEGVELPVHPALTPEAVPLLEDLLRTYEQLAVAGWEYPSLRSQAAEANFRIGDIRQRLGQTEGAATAFRLAAELFARLLKDEGSDASRVKLARAYNELGGALRKLGRLDEAAEAHRQGIEALRQAHAAFAQRPEARYELARSYFTLGQREMLLSEAPGGRPGKPGRRPGGPGQGIRGEPPPALRDNPTKWAADILEQLVREFPQVPEYRHLLACCYRDSPYSARAVELLRQLVKDFPRVPDYRLDLCETLARPAGIGPGQGKERRVRLEEAIGLARQLVEQYPNVPDYTAALARHLDQLGFVRFAAKEFDEAVKLHREALQLQDRLVKQCPEVPTYTFWQALIERALGRALTARRELKEGRALLQSAIDRAEALGKKDARLVGVRPFLALAYRDLAQAHTLAGEPALADQARRKAQTLGGDRPPGPAGFGPRR